MRIRNLKEKAIRKAEFKIKSKKGIFIQENYREIIIILIILIGIILFVYLRFRKKKEDKLEKEIK